MVRHSHHHVPAHIGGVRYVPPCCGCGGINRQTQARENAAKKAKQKAGFEHLQDLQRTAQQEAIPKHVREMAGIKIKQQLAKDTVSFAQVLQQKGVTKEKALEKLLDKLVGMYASEKELMKALKNLEFSKLMELLKKALSTVNESNMEKEDGDKKKVEKTNKKDKVIKVKEKVGDDEEIEEDDSEEENEEDDSDDENALNKDADAESAKSRKSSKNDSFEKQTSKTSRKRRKSKNKDQKSSNKKVTEKSEPEVAEKLEKTIPNQNFKINIQQDQVKFSGNTYSIEAKNLLKEQTDLEIAHIRREMIFEKQNKITDNPIKKDSPLDQNANKNESETINNKRLTELEKENEKLKKIILELEKERRSELISTNNRD